MRFVALLVLCLLCLGLVCTDGQAQCCGGGCGAPAPVQWQPSILSVTVEDYQWERSPSNPAWYGLRLRGVQVGAWDSETGAFHPYLGSDRWGKPLQLASKAAAKAGCGCARGCNCTRRGCVCKTGDRCCAACDCERAAEKRRPIVENYGILTDKRKRAGERYEHCGQPVSREEAIAALAGKIPDDRHKPSLSFFGGTEDERKAALAAARKMGLDETCLLNGYPADSPLAKPGFVTDGRPTAYLQQPDGKVLARTQEASEPTIGAIRKKVPDYDPAKDPDPTKKEDPLDPLVERLKKLETVPTWAWVVGGIVVVLWLKKEKK